MVEEQRELSTTVTQTLTTGRSYNAFGEVASETDDYKTCPNNAVGGSPGPATDVPVWGASMSPPSAVGLTKEIGQAKPGPVDFYEYSRGTL